MATGLMEPDPPDTSGLYPPAGLEELKEDRRSYTDGAAAELYKAAGVQSLTRSHAQMCRALKKQAEKLEQFHSTPFTEQNIQVMKATLEGIERAERLLERWHLLIFPNQTTTKDQRDVG